MPFGLRYAPESVQMPMSLIQKGLNRKFLLCHSAPKVSCYPSKCEFGVNLLNFFEYNKRGVAVVPRNTDKLQNKSQCKMSLKIGEYSF